MPKPVCVIVGIGPKNGAAFARSFSRAGYQLALVSRRNQFPPASVEALMELRNEGQRFVRQNVAGVGHRRGRRLGARAIDRVAHTRASWVMT